MNPFYNRSIISIRDIDRRDLDTLFNYTDTIAKMDPYDRLELAKAKVLGYAFFEPSTRTRLGFEAAMAMIGGKAIGISDIKSASIEKGESFRDTIKVLEAYSDVIVIRHNLDGSARFADEIASKPIINAGSGMEEHPTQAMLDLYTILKEHGRVDGLKIGIVGDLKYARTVYSFLYALDKYDVDIYLVSPKELRIRNEYIYGIRHKLNEYDDIEHVIDRLDVIYITRIQKERFPDEQEYEKVKGSYVINAEVLKKAKNNAIIMHPLPRVDEISYEVDHDPRAKYFKQVEYGKYVRAALLALILNEELKH